LSSWTLNELKFSRDSALSENDEIPKDVRISQREKQSITMRKIISHNKKNN